MRDGPGDVEAGRVIALFMRIYIYIYIDVSCMSWYCLWISIWRATPARRIGGNTSAYLHLAHFASNESIFRGPFIFYGTV